MSTVPPPLTTARGPDDELAALVASSEHARTQGAYQQGRRLAEQAVELADRLGDDVSLAVALQLICNQALRLGELEDAALAGRRAVVVFEGLGDDAGQVETLNLLAMTYLQLGLFEEALTAIERAMAAVVALDDHELRSGTFNRAGTVHSALADYDAAAAMFERAEQELRDAGVGPTPETEFCLLTNTTDLVIETARSGADVAAADLRAGVARAERALALAEDSGNPYRVALSHLNAGALLVHLDERDAAETHFAAAARISRANSYRSLELAVLQARAIGSQRRGDHAATLALLAELIALAEETHESSMLPKAHHAASVEWELLGDYRQALASYRRFHELETAARFETAEVRGRLLGMGEELHQLRRAAVALERRALEDALTGMGNRRMFDATVPGLFAAATPGDQLCVALLDLDHFKAVNDTFGHSTGDVVLTTLASLLRDSVRRDDVLVRLGGEEFAVVCVLREAGLAEQLAETCRARIEDHDWSSVAAGLRVTASIGVVTATAPLRGGIADLVATADRLLYAAKAAGRNRVHALALGEEVPQPDRRVTENLRDVTRDDVELA